MSDAAAKTRGGDPGDPLTFLREAVAALRQPAAAVPALLLLVILTFSNIVILGNLPPEGAALSLPFIAAAFVRVAGLLVLAVGILRILTDSSRRRWLPDGGFWLYVLTFAVSAGLSFIDRWLPGDGTGLLNLVASNLLTTLLLSPFIVWFVALAAARPLAWRPRPWLRGLGCWWPPLMLWTLLLVMPMAVLHAVIDLRLIEGVGDLFWPLALFDGALSTIMALLALCLNAAAYRRVASR